jgi:hypothetical protein
VLLLVLVVLLGLLLVILVVVVLSVVEVCLGLEVSLSVRTSPVCTRLSAYTHTLILGKAPLGGAGGAILTHWGAKEEIQTRLNEAIGTRNSWYQLLR